MIYCLGHSNPAGAELWYFVTGCLKSGYGILIREWNGEETKAFVSFSFSRTVRLARKLRRCSVFPENLPEILEDLRCATPAAHRLPISEEADLHAVLHPEQRIIGA